MFRPRNYGLAVLGFVAMMASASIAQAARIEADPNKPYTLTRDFGPWMVMVASFHSTGEDGETKVGKTPEEAAHELVIELRQWGIPAYVHAVNPSAAPVATQDSVGRAVRKRNLHQTRSIGVVAGNYKSIDDPTAQKTLKWLKEYNPKCLQNGVVFQKTEKRPTPLAMAFMTMNPLMPPEEVAAYRNVDNFVLKLNHGESNSLLENPGKFTLVVATFAGQSGVETPLGFGGRIGESFDDKDVKNDLDIAAEQARVLCGTMRQVENVDAYVWHDRYQSVVTVGAFSSVNDSSIGAMKARFGAKQQVNALVPRYNNSVQVLAIDAQGRKIPFDQSLGGLSTGSGALPEGFRIWAYDPSPQVMAVPKKR